MLGVLETLLGVSVVSLIGLYLAFIGLLPEIVIDGVVDKSRNFNSESKLEIKNNGRLSALEIRADTHSLCVKMGGLVMNNCSAINCGPPVASKLSSGERTEMTIRPGLGLDQGAKFERYSYDLTLNYYARLLIFKKVFAKTWHIELRNFGNEYSWDVTIV